MAHNFAPIWANIPLECCACFSLRLAMGLERSPSKFKNPFACHNAMRGRVGMRYCGRQTNSRSAHTPCTVRDATYSAVMDRLPSTKKPSKSGVWKWEGQTQVIFTFDFLCLSS